MLKKPFIPILKSGPNPTLDPLSDEEILSEFLGKSTLGDPACAAALVGNGENWMDPIRAYLTNQETLVDDANMERTSHKAMLYTMVDGILYKRGHNGVLLKGITQTEGISLFHDIHEGICGSHISHRALVGKAFRQGFYRPTALQDTTELVRTCESCQFFV